MFCRPVLTCFTGLSDYIIFFAVFALGIAVSQASAKGLKTSIFDVSYGFPEICMHRQFFTFSDMHGRG
jgi:hypothetical protein